MSDELKPCPCCGYEAVFGQIGGDAEAPDFGAHFIQCTNGACGTSSALVYPLMDDAKPLLRERWNRRAPPAPRAPVVAEPVAWLITGSKAWADRPCLTREAAERDAANRVDGSHVVPLYLHPNNAQSSEPITDAQILKLAGEWLTTGENQKRDRGYAYRSIGEQTNVLDIHLIAVVRAALAAPAHSAQSSEHVNNHIGAEPLLSGSGEDNGFMRVCSYCGSKRCPLASNALAMCDLADQGRGG